MMLHMSSLFCTPSTLQLQLNSTGDAAKVIDANLSGLALAAVPEALSNVGCR